jgi:phenylpropionate dioxygenase-like ring-hydroxylating dioxygenase large terminal subunit
VLFRDSEGRIGALLDRCPHRNAPLSQGRVEGGRLVCPYHGWEFDRAGQCQAVPGLCDDGQRRYGSVRSYPAAEQDGLVWVYPDHAALDSPPQIDLLHQPGYVSLTHDFMVEADLVDAVENFLDATHTHFVHAGLVRTQSKRRPVQAIVRHGADRVEAEYLEESQSGLIARFFGVGITRSIGRFVLPSIVQLEYWAGERLKLLITLYFTPQAPSQQRVFAVAAANPSPWPFWLVRLPFAWMLKRVVRQDQRILALQSANLRRFGGPRYASTELDILRPHILRLLDQTRPLPDASTEKPVTLML